MFQHSDVVAQPLECVYMCVFVRKRGCLVHVHHAWRGGFNGRSKVKKWQGRVYGQVVLRMVGGGGGVHGQGAEAVLRGQDGHAWLGLACREHLRLAMVPTCRTPAASLPHLVAHIAVVVEALLQRGTDRQIHAKLQLQGLPQQVRAGMPVRLHRA